MIIYIASPGTGHPHAPPPDDWSVLGSADDSTLPTDGDELLRLCLDDRSAEVRLPLAATAVWIPDLGVYHPDVRVDIHGAEVITLSRPGGRARRHGGTAAHADPSYDEPGDAPLASLDDDD